MDRFVHKGAKPSGAKKEVKDRGQDQAVLETLKEYFGYSYLREGQKMALSAAISGSDTLVVMATGAGKSICYQLPALLEDEGVVVVISPLISLMYDQVAGLAARNIQAVATADPRAETEVFGRRTRLVYTTPETALGRWKDKLRRLHDEVGVKLLAVDEAHCVSEWGHDFRPEYQRLAELRQILPRVPVMALTATATPDVQREIIKNLQLKGAGRMGEPVKVVTTFDRPNLHYSARERSDGAFEAVFQPLVDSVKDGVHEPVIVYALTQKDTEKLVRSIQGLGMPRSRVAFYHAGMSDKERTQVHDDFLHDRLSIVVATTAFGMGVDKPDVRHVVHWGAPKTLESYYQQSGRAGRDGIDSRCVLLYNGKDFAMSSFYEQGSDGRIISEVARKALHDGMLQIKRYCHSTRCRREMLLGYFGDAVQDNGGQGCRMCDNCERRRAGDFQEGDVEAPTRQLLEAVRVCGERFGILKYVGFIKGLSTAPENCKGKSGYNTGAAYSTEYWKALAQQLLAIKPPLLQEEQKVSGGWNGSKQQTFKIVKLSSEGERFLSCRPKGQPFMMVLPAEMRTRVKHASSAAGAAANRSADGASQPQADSRSKASVLSLGKFKYKKGVQHSLECEEEEELFTRLVKVREMVAKERGVPLAHVCDENTLVSLTRERPSSMENLRLVHGAHNKFVERYGKEFVESVVRFCEQPFLTIQLDGFRSGSRQNAVPQHAGARVLPGCMTKAISSLDRKLSAPRPASRSTSPPTSRKPPSQPLTPAEESSVARSAGGGFKRAGQQGTFVYDLIDDGMEGSGVANPFQPEMDMDHGRQSSAAPGKVGTVVGNDRAVVEIETEYVDDEEWAMYEEIEKAAMEAAAGAAAASAAQHTSAVTKGAQEAKNGVFQGSSRPSLMERQGLKTNEAKEQGRGDVQSMGARRPSVMEYIKRREAEESHQDAQNASDQSEGESPGNDFGHISQVQARNGTRSPQRSTATETGNTAKEQENKPDKRQRLGAAEAQQSSKHVTSGKKEAPVVKVEAMHDDFETLPPVEVEEQSMGKLGSIAQTLEAKIQRQSSLKKELTQSELRKVIGRFHGRSVDERELMRIFGVQTEEEKRKFEHLVLVLIENGDIVRNGPTRLESV